MASTIWGSYAFLVGSYLQLLEAMNKHVDSLAVAGAVQRRERALRAPAWPSAAVGGAGGRGHPGGMA